ncbi:MAG: ribosome-associated protein [Actinomycetota bacterium]|jgi:ribosome-associated protein|nr:ribosome-associated protein [Actinomycetota bacterium]
MTAGTDLVLKAAEAASDKKAERIVILDVSKQLVITDHFLICSAKNERQVRTIADEVQKQLTEIGEKPFRREGEREGRWVLLDYVDFVVHVFHEDERDYYDLERLWSDAQVLPFEERLNRATRVMEENDEPAAAEAT